MKKLFALLTLALCWAVKVGQWLHEAKPLVVKAHGRLAKSVFRYGFDHLRHIFMNLAQPQQQDFQLAIRFLSCTQGEMMYVASVPIKKALIFFSTLD